VCVALVLFTVFTGALAAYAGPDWREEWEKTLRAGKQEGRLVIYTFTAIRRINIFAPSPERLFIISTTTPIWGI
jgi:hypothetical protein